jgi:hypothetical protein
MVRWVRSAPVDDLQASEKRESQTELAAAMVVEVREIGVHCDGPVAGGQEIGVHRDSLVVDAQEIGADGDRQQCLVGEQLLGRREDSVG